MNAAIVIQRRDRDAGPVAAATFAQLPVFIFEVAVAHGLRQFNVAADTVVRIKHRKMPTGDITAAIAGALLRTKVPADDIAIRIRSEEHTSELQSLMRISYAVFCLKKKKNHKTNTHTQQT